MPRLVRDRTTWLLYVQLGLWGFFLYGFGPVVPLLRDEQGTTAAVAGLHSTALAAGGLIGGALFPPLSRRLGRARTMWLSLAGLALATALLVTSTPLPATLLAAAVASTFGWMTVSCAVSELTSHHGPFAPTAITEANAAAVAFGMLSPLLIGLSTRLWDTWRPGMATLVLLIAAVAAFTTSPWVRRPRTPTRSEPGPPLVPPAFPGPATPPAPVVSSEPRGSGVEGGRRLPRAYWMAWSLLGVTGSIEVCLSLWAADVLRDHAGMSPGGASATVAAIVGGMLAGRLAGARIALRVRPVPLLLAALGVSAAGFVLFWASPVGWLAAAGLIVLGLGNAMHYPLTISLAMAGAPGQADLAAATANYSVAIGFGAAPLLLGWVADQIGPHPAFLLLPALILAAALIVLRLGRTLPDPAAH
ncbi:MFS transporter [Catenuloplanes japonicus]|uniref:MFS transporter n=1 Tax=Catenuloplanes japonicus TaxID=33876 RepID=UPI0005247456|nr:MFS transporter [Catenuloplanes japonicus]